MGALRLVLALGVAAEHANAPLWIGSYSAVQAFFVISGFYMALIFSGRYGSPRDFYLSRFLRLFPVYWLAAVVAIGVYALALEYGIAHGKFEQLSHGGTHGIAVALWATVANVTMVAADWSWFIPASALGGQHGTSLLLIPPVWTLSLELMFYAACPWLMRLTSSKLVVLFCLSIAARTYGYWHGLDDDPWHARFFGFELAFFLLGILAYRVYRGLGNNFLQRKGRRPLAWLVTVGMLSFSTLFIPINTWFGIAFYQRTDFGLSLVYYVALFLALPYMFALTKNSRFDRYVGEYSYPVYLTHYIFVIVFVHTRYAEEAGVSPLVSVLVAACAVSAMLIHMVQMPVDRWRRRLARSSD